MHVCFQRHEGDYACLTHFFLEATSERVLTDMEKSRMSEDIIRAVWREGRERGMSPADIESAAMYAALDCYFNGPCGPSS